VYNVLYTEIISVLNRTVTNSVEINLSREAASCADTRELPRILWNPKVHYRFHKNRPLVSILSQISSVHITASYIPLRPILMLSTNIRFVLPSGLFPSGFRTIPKPFVTLRNKPLLRRASHTPVPHTGRSLLHRSPLLFLQYIRCHLPYLEADSPIRSLGA
jgi:hypothetical protein